MMSMVESAKRSIFKRFLHGLPVATGLLLTIAVACVWIRSYFVGDHYYWVGMHDDAGSIAYRSRGLIVSMGGVETYGISLETSNQWSIWDIRRQYHNDGSPLGFGHGTNPNPRYPMPRGSADDSLVSSLGFFYLDGLRRDDGYLESRTVLTVPIWLIISLTAAYPIGVYVAGVFRRQREDRIALGLCPRCGWALDDDSTRCPGCDKPVAVPQHV